MNSMHMQQIIDTYQFRAFYNLGKDDAYPRRADHAKAPYEVSSTRIASLAQRAIRRLS